MTGIGFTTEAQSAQRRTEAGVNSNNNFSLSLCPLCLCGETNTRTRH